MLDAKALRAEMVLNGYTNSTMAEALGRTSRTFTTRLKTGDFGAKEIEIMITKLNLDNPMEIFFAQKVT